MDAGGSTAHPQHQSPRPRFEHWDFSAQLQGLMKSVGCIEKVRSVRCAFFSKTVRSPSFRVSAVHLLNRNDFRAPETIKHLFPRHVAKWQEKLIKDQGDASRLLVLQGKTCWSRQRGFPGFAAFSSQRSPEFRPEPLWLQQSPCKDNIAEKEMGKFEEIRQFFFLYETTGSNMMPV